MTSTPADRPMRRSLLFVPGADSKKVEKARESGADTIVFDLEDSVAPEAKEAARGIVARAIGSAAHGDAEPAVRVNAPGTEQFEKDLEAVVAAGARADAALGLALGFEGKLCIHPAQVRIVHEVYTPSDAEIAHAERVVEAWERARGKGVGVFQLDGKMIDAPLVRVQQRILARARQARKPG